MTALAWLASLAVICGGVAAVKWIDRCDCRFANDTHEGDD